MHIEKITYKNGRIEYEVRGVNGDLVRHGVAYLWAARLALRSAKRQDARLTVVKRDIV